MRLVTLALLCLALLPAQALAIGNNYPSVPADRDGDFDPGCGLFDVLGGWETDNIGSDRPGFGAIERTIVGEGLCSARLWGFGEHRAEVAWSSIADPNVVVEQLLRVPSSSGNLGFVNQFKQSGSASGCANGGISHRSASVLEYTVRASCSADNVRFNLGTFPRDKWFALRFTYIHGEQGMAAASIDLNPFGPEPYVRRLHPTTVDNKTGDSNGVKFRAGTYSDQDAEVYLDGYALDCRPTTC